MLLTVVTHLGAAAAGAYLWPKVTALFATEEAAVKADVAKAEAEVKKL